MKEILFKLLFPSKYDRIDHLENESAQAIQDLDDRIEVMESALEKQPTMADLMRDSLGLPMINFTNVDDKGYPPHFLDGLVPEQRKQYISEMVQIYKNEKFKTIIEYTINLLGNHSIQKADKDKMENGRIGIIALKTFRKEFENVLTEYEENHKPEDEFDEHAVLSES